MPFSLRPSSVAHLVRKHPLMSLIVAFAALGATGAGLKYLDEDAQRQKLLKPQDRSLLARVNPFLAPPPPTPTPQLSKELIYAGSRLLAIEDANANAAPPADLAVWRPSNGTWYVLGGPGSQQTIQGWGLNGDIPVPGDFDGDGKTDFSVWRPSDGKWYVINTSDSSWSITEWGLTNDVPAPADYDGDGKTDRAVFRPAESKWYIFQSSNSAFVITPFGISGDTPAPADYDGDGKADIGVWRTSNRKFYSINSSNLAFYTIDPNFDPSNPDWEVVSSDYDGDGKADYAIYDKTAANWYIRSSITGTFPTNPVTWGSAGDRSVPNDYDGDAKTDLAVWRNSNGHWYINNSSGGTREEAWGLPGDIPVPAFYRR